jgi:hypothetical protein
MHGYALDMSGTLLQTVFWRWLTQDCQFCIFMQQKMAYIAKSQKSF